MKRQNRKILISLWLAASLLWQATALRAQQIEINQDSENQDRNQVYRNLLQQAEGAELAALLEKFFGGESDAARDALAQDSQDLVQSVSETAAQKADARLEEQIAERREKKNTKPVIESTPATKTKPSVKPAVKSKKLSFNDQPRLNWRQFAFGFQPMQQDEKPEIKMTETDKEIKAEGTDKKTFETKDAKGTRTQKAETRYTKDGKTFGMEIKNTQVIEAVSKPDGKSFRQEISMVWGADVAACPDVNGVTAGTGKAKIISKTIYTEAGATVAMSSEFDLRAKLKGFVNDRAEFRYYDMQVETYTTNTGYEDARQRMLIKEVKIKDGSYELDFDIPGNTPEWSDGTYGGNRTPAKMGKPVGRKITPMPEADAKALGSAIGPMVPSIWNSANEMYKAAERNWQNYGCVEVVCKVPKTTLKNGEEITISTETVHLQDGGKVNAEMEASGYPGQATPESQTAKPGATFTFTNEATEDHTTFMVRSVSKRGIGRGEVEFQVEKEKEEAESAGIWTGTISAQRKQREEREKRAGANLQENGGYMETVTNVQLQVTGRLDRTVDATNAYIADMTGIQELVDYEYDRYKIDEGYCGPNAVPYKGPKEITRTSTTTADYGNKETRAYLEIGGSGGTITFSLPEISGRTVHKYVHKSPCAEHDRTNTNEAINEDAATPGGNFSFSFPVDPAQKTVKGTVTVRDEDGGTTVYTWELTRR